jgi:hypothetical protein
MDRYLADLEAAGAPAAAGQVRAPAAGERAASSGSAQAAAAGGTTFSSTI